MRVRIIIISTILTYILHFVTGTIGHKNINEHSLLIIIGFDIQVFIIYFCINILLDHYLIYYLKLKSMLAKEKKEWQMPLTSQEQDTAISLLKELYMLSQLTTMTRSGQIVNGMDHNVALAKLEVCENKVLKFLYGK